MEGACDARRNCAKFEQCARLAFASLPGSLHQAGVCLLPGARPMQAGAQAGTHSCAQAGAQAGAKIQTS
eukprot:1867617-Pyramimonas_sp.AAC.1